MEEGSFTRVEHLTDCVVTATIRGSNIQAVYSRQQCIGWIITAATRRLCHHSSSTITSLVRYAQKMIETTVSGYPGGHPDRERVSESRSTTCAARTVTIMPVSPSQLNDHFVSVASVVQCATWHELRAESALLKLCFIQSTRMDASLINQAKT